MKDLRTINVTTIENKALLDAIMTEDENGNFWDSEKYRLILEEIQENGFLRRHPVHIDYVVDVISGTVYRTRGRVICLNVSTQRGYESISIRRGKNDFLRVYLNRFVMEAFLGRPLEDGYDVHHYGYVPVKNSIYNLRYTTHKLNCQIRHSDKPIQRPRYWYLVQDDDATVYVGKTEQACARFLGVSKSTVHGVCTGKQKTVAGYTIYRGVR